LRAERGDKIGDKVSFLEGEAIGETKFYSITLKNTCANKNEHFSASKLEQQANISSFSCA